VEPVEYEMLTQEIWQELLGVSGTRAWHQMEYKGRISGRSIKVDVSFTVDVAGATILVAIECKHYPRRVGVGEIEEFSAKMADIGAHKGIVVTTVGYQRGAIKSAEGRGIALAILAPRETQIRLQYVLRSREAAGGEKGSMDVLQGRLCSWEPVPPPVPASWPEFSDAEKMLSLLGLQPPRTRRTVDRGRT